LRESFLLCNRFLDSHTMVASEQRSGMSKSAQVTFGVTLVALLCISFWEEVTDLRLLGSTDYGKMESQKYNSLEAYMDKFDEGELEEWELEEDWDLTEDQLNEMTMNEEYWEDDDMLFGDEMMWGEGGYDGEDFPGGGQPLQEEDEAAAANMEALNNAQEDLAANGLDK